MRAKDTFTPLERRKLLDAYYSTLEKLQVTGAGVDHAMTDARPDLESMYAYLRGELSDLLLQYRDGLPRPVLSRCPFTGVEVRHSIDPNGLDGLWWDYEEPTRPVEYLPPTYFAVRGALTLTEDVERTRFLCVPGPEVPYVLPRLLNREEIKAVLSPIMVGKHRAYAIFYFADPHPEIEGVNVWGTNTYSYVDPRGLVWPRHSEPPFYEMDFELASWIRSGKLLWIAPGDNKMLLHSEVSMCPYLELSGRRSVLRIQEGKVWAGNENPVSQHQNTASLII